MKSEQESATDASGSPERRVMLPQQLNDIAESAEEDKGGKEHRIVSYHELAPFVHSQKPANESATHRTYAGLPSKEEQPAAWA